MAKLTRADQFEKKEWQLRVALEETTQRLGQHFANPAARATAGGYLQSLSSGVERKNGWQLAQAAGLDTPYRFQHLLGRGAWEADALRDEQLGVVLAGLGEEEAVLAVDETAFIQAGQKSVGVKRQYTGTSLHHPYGKEWQRFLLLRRSRAKAGEITAYLVFGAADTDKSRRALAFLRREYQDAAHLGGFTLIGTSEL